MTIIPGEAVMIAEGNYKLCTHCQNFSSGSDPADHCMVCGEELVSVCPHCGAPIQYSVAQFCPMCGISWAHWNLMRNNKESGFDGVEQPRTLSLADR
jgi:hypothetical protein